MMKATVLRASGKDRNGGLLVAQPKMAPTAETDLEFYRAQNKPQWS